MGKVVAAELLVAVALILQAAWLTSAVADGIDYTVKWRGEPQFVRHVAAPH